MKLLTKHIPSAFWHYVEHFVYTGLSRVILFPFAAHHIGKDEFGLFATALSFSMLIGHQPANGLSVGLLRNLSNYSEDEQDQFVFSARKLCQKLLYILIPLLFLITGVLYAYSFITRSAFLCLVFLFGSLYPENLFMLNLTPMRYRREFRSHALWYVGLSLTVVALGAIGVFLYGMVGLAGGMMIGNFVWLGILNKKETSRYKRQGHTTAQHDKILTSVWLHLSVAGILTIAGPHLNRIVLRIFWSNAAVAELFAATSILHLFTLPLTNLNKLFLGLLSKYKDISQISKRKVRVLVPVILTSSLIVMLLFWIFAPLGMRILFPSFGDQALALLNILIWTIPFVIANAFVRPLLTKFADIRWIPRINLAVLSTKLALMLVLIPQWGLKGAALSITFSAILEATFRAILLVLVTIKLKRKL